MSQGANLAAWLVALMLMRWVPRHIFATVIAEDLKQIGGLGVGLAIIELLVAAFVALAILYNLQGQPMPMQFFGAERVPGLVLVGSGIAAFFESLIRVRFGIDKFDIAKHLAMMREIQEKSAP